MNFFRTITRKVTAIILVSLILGIGIVVFYFAYSQNSTLYLTAERNLYQQADVMHQSIKNSMLPGEAPLVVSLFNDIQTISSAFNITLYRRNGVVAFSDDTTLEEVNANIGMQRFQPKEFMLQGDPMSLDDPYFRSAVTTGRTEACQTMQETKRWFTQMFLSLQAVVLDRPKPQETKTFLTIYKPLLNLPKCSGCHGSNHTIRGVITIQSDMTPIFTQARNNIGIAMLFFIGVVCLLFLILSLFLRQTVITPIQSIGHVATEVTKGNFKEKTSIKSHDEIGELGEKINTMVDGLYERFALSKYVSSSTLESLKNSEKGTHTEMTLFFSDIRGFTSFSEKREPSAIVEQLNKVLNVQTEIIQRYGGDIDKYVGDEIVALFMGPEKEKHACRAAVEIQTYILLYKDELSNLSVGIGINTGEVVLGRIGSEKRADFTVIGDHVNFASRLCSEAKAGMVMISESTYQEIRHNAEVRGPYDVKVKGKEYPQKVYVLDMLEV